ncbi:carboxypeptidase-like regulatory domain-containing protein [Flavobacterium terrisoli]|uniref:carboxypeptidase-like regulatory domain-containing protein n=1 Tax=Flavobacterium terrisoli TaxID=3242195 RepID=UPI002543A55E|nr:carboxypeptidase-like regulatory domain-containing protein [Flavobacterium buctense]
MTNKINISIPQPCHENWEAMTAVDKGKFCASCQKKVYDFTKASDREIVTAFQQNQNLCGRFLTTQLDRDLVKPNEKSSVWLATTATIVSMIGLGTNEAIAQGEPVKTEQTDRRVLLGKSAPPKSQEIEVSGIVKDATGPLPGVNIVIKGTTVYTATDFDGNFKLKAKAGDVLVFQFTGMETKEIKITNNSPLNLEMKMDDIIMGEMVVGGLVRKRTFFGRIFHSIGNWFR